MNEFSEDGYFWLPDNPAARVAGRLSFSAGIGPALTISGKLPPVEREIEFPVIHGQTFRHGNVTITDAFVEREEGKPEQGFERQRLVANRAYLGEHLPHDVMAKSVAMQFFHLDSWMDRPTALPGPIEEDEPDWYRLNLTVSVPKPVKAEISLARVTFAFSVGSMKVFLPLAVRVEPFVRIDTDRGLSVDEWLDQFIFPIRDLVSLSAGNPSLLTELAILDFGEEKKVDVCLLEMRHEPQEKRRRSHELLWLHDLGKDPSAPLNAWLTNRESLGLSMASFFSVAYTAEESTEARFLGVMQALELYHRRTDPATELPPDEHKQRRKAVVEGFPQYKEWLDRKLCWNEPTQHARLDALRRRAEPLLGVDDEIIKKRIRQAVDTRNYLIHGSHTDHVVTGWNLLDLTETLIALQECLFLLDMGIPDAVIRDRLGSASRNRGRRDWSRATGR